MKGKSQSKHYPVTKASSIFNIFTEIKSIEIPISYLMVSQFDLYLKKIEITLTKVNESIFDLVSEPRSHLEKLNLEVTKLSGLYSFDKAYTMIKNLRQNPNGSITLKVDGGIELTKTRMLTLDQERLRIYNFYDKYNDQLD